MKNKIYEMLKLQEKMNTTVNPDWKTAGNKWTDAIMVECVEAMEHYGWKWWKKQVPDIAQTKMELVDIWHFALSLAMEKSGLPNDELSYLIEDGIKKTYVQIENNPDTFLDNIRNVIRAAGYGEFDAVNFFSAMKSVNMTFDELYIQYIGKNCLNIFRQNHGYKNGSYIKDWSIIGFKEDNDCLLNELNNLPIDDISFDLYPHIYTNLGINYAKVINPV